MAFLRKRKKADEPQPRRSDPANQTPAATSADQWRPKTVSQAMPALKEPAGRGGSWLPEGVAHPPPGQRHARSSGAIPIPPEAVAATAPPAEAPATDPRGPAPTSPPPATSAPAAPARPAPAPSADRDELHARIASLEQQIDAAKAGRTSEQDATIRALQMRQAALEEELQKTDRGHARQPAAPGATALRVLLLIAVFLVIAGSPLFMSRRTVCHVHGRPQTHWAVVKPFDDSGKPGCDNQLGGSVLLNSIK